MASKVKLYLLTAFIAWAASTPVSGNSEVMESSATYSCCSRPVIHFRQSCDNTWTVRGTTFTYSKTSSGTNSVCVSPCRTIEGGEMTLETCVYVNVTTVCTEMNRTVEKRTYYQSYVCPESWSNAARHCAHAAALLLLALVSAGQFVEDSVC